VLQQSEQEKSGALIRLSNCRVCNRGELNTMISRSAHCVNKTLLATLSVALAGLIGCAPDPAANAPPTYVNSCAWCHAEGTGGAPVTGDKEEWERRTSKGMAKVYANAIDGFEGATGIMPPKGSRTDLTDEEVKEIVDWMVAASK
jgi:cytochrome c5